MQSAAPLVMAFVAERASDATALAFAAGFAVVALACFAAIAGRPASEPPSGAAEHRVDVVLGGMAAIAGQLRTVEEAAFGRVDLVRSRSA